MKFIPKQTNFGDIEAEAKRLDDSPSGFCHVRAMKITPKKEENMESENSCGAQPPTQTSSELVRLNMELQYDLSMANAKAHAAEVIGKQYVQQVSNLLLELEKPKVAQIRNQEMIDFLSNKLRENEQTIQRQADRIGDQTDLLKVSVKTTGKLRRRITILEKALRNLK